MEVSLEKPLSSLLRSHVVVTFSRNPHMRPGIRLSQVTPASLNVDNVTNFWSLWSLKMVGTRKNPTLVALHHLAACIHFGQVCL